MKSVAGRVETGTDPGAARLASMVDLMLTAGYIDGVFHHRERAFVEHYLDTVLVMIEQSAAGTAEERARHRAAWRTHCDQLYRHLEGEVAALAPELAAADAGAYVDSRLRDRAVAVFRTLSPADQATALELVTALVHADGQVTTHEHALHDELQRLLAAEPAPARPAFGPNAPTVVDRSAATAASSRAAGGLSVAPYVHKQLVALSHPLLDPLEQTLSPHPIERQAQIEWDYQLLQRAVAQWQRQRADGAHRLNGISTIDQLPVGSRFLDRYVHVMRPSEPVELIVLGDLHGCYSCLKAALLQSNFIQRAWAHQWDPRNHPDVKLVLLGDYIDRGRFSFDGVLRTVLHLFVSLPDHVIVLRGNHEWLRWFDNRITSGVYPAEALASIMPHVPVEMLEAYRLLFEHMPTSFLCERTLLVHGGIPRDDTFAERYRDLSSLNDDELRFQMMWSDPVAADHVPVEQQRTEARFTFGRSQFEAFMKRIGMRALIRGHEKIDHGFDVFFDRGEHALVRLFSSGGSDNADLPLDSGYRTVTPMALTLHADPDRTTLVPWMLHYQPFNYEPHNGLYRRQPLLEYRYG